MNKSEFLLNLFSNLLNIFFRKMIAKIESEIEIWISDESES